LISGRAVRAALFPSVALEFSEIIELIGESRPARSARSLPRLMVEGRAISRKRGSTGRICAIGSGPELRFMDTDATKIGVR
jgi:hypothetical protein